MTEEIAEKRFVVDIMLGKVAKWLRILGFDTLYIRLANQNELDAYAGQGFLVITRNQKWCGRSRVFCPRANDPVEQLREIIAAVSIDRDEIRLLTRCVLCNRLLQTIQKDRAFGLVPDYVFETNAVFFKCPACQKIYWPGSHPKRITARLHSVLGWSF
jgi:uncharacterized protein with PIN domain